MRPSLTTASKTVVEVQVLLCTDWSTGDVTLEFYLTGHYYSDLYAWRSLQEAFAPCCTSGTERAYFVQCLGCNSDSSICSCGNINLVRLECIFVLQQEVTFEEALSGQLPNRQSSLSLLKGCSSL